jgi:type IV pilus assembly protein PilB
VITNETLKKALQEIEILPAAKLEEAYKNSTDRGESLADFLVERNILSDENMGRVLADIYGLPFINLRNETIAEDVLKIIPAEMVRRSWVYPFKQDANSLYVAVNDPDNLEPLSYLAKKIGSKKLILAYATQGDMELSIFRMRKDIKTVFEDYIAEIEKKHREKPDISIEDALKELPIVEIVDNLLLYAYQSGTSDIHIEPQEHDALVRFRIDGLMHDIIRYPKYMHELLVARLKILSKLRTDEHFASQDGKLRTMLEGEAVDVRINVIPIIEGEKVVMRLMTERGRRFYLESIGLSEIDIEKVRRAIRRPFGMILATGPTGSGKTTTLYALLRLLNTTEVNITTIEDPIEYDITGINQIQVNPKTGITFAAGLRAIVRQNPDIIMVGEIRDEETASITVNAAMTGHLVLSTLHTNNAATTLPRLLDMHIEPFLIASSVNILISQRLARRICPRCIRSISFTVEEAKPIMSPELLKRMFGRKKEITIYQGDKCQLCRHTGYVGRLGVFEVMEMSEEVRRLIMSRANADDIERQAVKEGMRTILEDGVNKVLSGQTTVDELLRVIHD